MKPNERCFLKGSTFLVILFAMKPDFKYLFILSMCFSFTFCKDSKKTDSSSGDQSIDMSCPRFSEQDTTEVMRLTDEYLEHLKNRDYKAAIGMLHRIQNDSVYPLPKEDIKQMKMQFEAIPGIKVTLDGIKLDDEHESVITYSVELFEKSEGQEHIPNTMKFSLNPQKIDGVWYLCVLNK